MRQLTFESGQHYDRANYKIDYMSVVRLGAEGTK
jgi:hypothetical protein